MLALHLYKKYILFFLPKRKKNPSLKALSDSESPKTVQLNRGPNTRQPSNAKSQQRREISKVSLKNLSRNGNENLHLTSRKWRQNIGGLEKHYKNNNNEQQQKEKWECQALFWNAVLKQNTIFLMFILFGLIALKS